LKYYQNNVVGLVNLLEAMTQTGCRKIIYSSSAAVYSGAATAPIAETARLDPPSPYGRTKLIGEQILADVHRAQPAWRIALLRYFNPVGAHPSGLLGETPRWTPGNLFPLLAQVASGARSGIEVFGGDYPTPDGSAIRDYIHVCDLAEGHLRALEKLDERSGVEAINLGTGRGYSVLEAIRAFSQASGREIPYRMASRRPGDSAITFADVAKCRRQFGWVAARSFAEMCRDTWHWAQASSECRAKVD
jgi:UDP-glucose 4-epimerase